MSFADLDAIFARAMRAWRPVPSDYRRAIRELGPGWLRLTQLARMLGVNDRTVGDWAAKDLIPYVAIGGRKRFALDLVQAALAKSSWSGGPLFDPRGARGQMVLARAAEREAGIRTCCGCRRQLPFSAYPPSSGKSGGWMCRGCRRAYTRASDLRRRGRIRSTRIERVDIEVIAARDGWRCGICGGKVTREDWSHDHVVPLSKGGSHTYDNVVLAHLACNVRRGAGRLPVQAPLFARI